MDYEKHYNLLIEKHGTWEKPKGVYTERHRKLPGSMGGKYAKGNAFYMSARAHYLAHLILAKIYPKDPSIWLAVSVMSGKHKRKIPSWWYGKAREQCLPYWKERGVKLGKTALERGYLKSAIEAARFSENQKSAARENQKKCVAAVLGKVPVTDPKGKYRLAFPYEVSGLLYKGWKEGHVGWVANTSAANAKCRGSRLMIDDNGKTRFVKPENVEDRIKEGWVLKCQSR